MFYMNVTEELNLQNDLSKLLLFLLSISLALIRSLSKSIYDTDILLFYPPFKCLCSVLHRRHVRMCYYDQTN